MLITDIKAFEEGRKALINAYDTKLPIDKVKNPYDRNSVQWGNWNMGWNAALDEIVTDFD